LIFSLSPPVAAVMSLGIGDRLSLRQWAAMGVTLAGVAWVVLERPNGEEHPELLRRRWRGIALSVFAAVTSAAAAVFSRQAMLGYNNPMAATMIRALAALAGYVVLIALWGRWPGILAAARHRCAMRFLVPGSVFGPFLGMTLFLTALRYSSVGVVATITATMPVMVLPFSALVHHERITRRAVLGAILTVEGVAMLMLGR
jgi:drug/metabolite transporter (DMT)-like permease